MDFTEDELTLIRIIMGKMGELKILHQVMASDHVDFNIVEVYEQVIGKLND